MFLNKRVMNLKDAQVFYLRVVGKGFLSEEEERFMRDMIDKLSMCALARNIPKAHRKRIIEIGERCRLWLIEKG